MPQLPPLQSTPSAGSINPKTPETPPSLLEKPSRVCIAAAHTGIIELSGHPVPFTINPIARKKICAKYFFLYSTI
jgi:hypothetical protein